LAEKKNVKDDDDEMVSHNDDVNEGTIFLMLHKPFGYFYLFFSFPF
jgi:hypothetical protein